MSALISSAVARQVAGSVGVAADLRELGRAVERDPAHQLGGDVLLRLAAGLPDALVRLAPYVGRALGLRLDDRPQPPRQTLAAPRVQQDRVERRAEDVVLALVERTVADTHRTGSGVSGQLVSRGLREITAPVDPVHDLEGPVLVRLEVGDELHELVGLPVQVEEMQSLKREGRVPDPGVAVVPVALPAGRLGERGGGRCHRRAGRHVGEALDRQRRALDRIAPAVVWQPRLPQPAAPELDGRRDARVGLVHVLWHDLALRPRERAVDLVAFLQPVARSDAVALDAEREVRLQPDREAGPARVCGMPVVADHRPLRRNTPIVEVRLADQLQLEVALEAEGGAHQHMIAVVVDRRPGMRGDLVLAELGAHGQGVAHEDPSGRRLPRRRQDVRPRLVHARGGDVDPERRESERASLAIEQGAEHTGPVEARHAQPVDRAVRGHQCARVAVRQERVVGDRRERRRRRGALCGRRARRAHSDTHGACQRPCPARRSSAAGGPHDPFSYGWTSGGSRAAAASPASSPRRCPVA